MALNASVMTDPCGGLTMYIFRPRTRAMNPTMNMQRHSRKADQNPMSRSMYGVARRDRAPMLMQQ